LPVTSTSGDRVPFDGGDHRLVEEHPGRPHRSRTIVGHPVPTSVAHGFQVGAGTERPGRTREDRDQQRVVGVERGEHGFEGVGRGSVDGVAHLGSVDGDDEDRSLSLRRDGHGSSDPAGGARAR
jgi:hypothetical protein